MLWLYVLCLNSFCLVNMEKVVVHFFSTVLLCIEVVNCETLFIALKFLSA